MGFQVSRRTALCLWRRTRLGSRQGQQIADHPANRKNNHGCDEKSEADHGLAPILEYRLQLTPTTHDMSKSGTLCRDKNGVASAKTKTRSLANPRLPRAISGRNSSPLSHFRAECGGGGGNE